MRRLSQTKVALAVGKPHFNLLALVSRMRKFGCRSHGPYLFPLFLVDSAGDNAFCSLRAAEFQRTAAAVFCARQIRHRAVVAHQAGTFQAFAVRTSECVCFGIKAEFGAGEEPLVWCSRSSGGMCGSMSRCISHLIIRPDP
jgi:hypothetical protein